MAFWGIEIRPGKPYTHRYDDSHGRLRICQATLGNGKSTSKSVVQCNVGDKSPVLLCSLIPDVSETCHLELEFEEDDEVIFSVLGQRSVHLSGYYLGSNRNLGGDETDSYGEDIAESDTSGSYSSYGSDDEYDSDFIDDGDIDMFPTSNGRKSNVVIEEIVEDEKPSNGNANRRRLKKKYQLSDSDDGSRQLVKHNASAILESEDEDGFPISFSVKRKNVGKDSPGNAKSDDKTVDEDRKRKIDSVSQDAGPSRESCKQNDSSIPTEVCAERSVRSKKKKKDRDGKLLETGSKASTEEEPRGEPRQNQDDKEVGIQNDEVQPVESKVETRREDLPRMEKKKNERIKRGKKSEERTEEGPKEIHNEPINNDNMDQDPPINGEPEKFPAYKEAEETSGKLKKKKKKKKTKDVEGEKNLQPKESELDVDESKLQKSEGIGKTEKISMELPNDKSLQHDVKKKKKNKNRDKDSIAIQGPTNDLVDGSDEPKTEDKSIKTRTFPNGLVVEELAMGKPDGKRASPGNKVSVNYIGKLKNGTIFDSNVGQRPYTFRLGVGHVIKGWDIGVAGMRVGDKRRLTIPPSFGYGAKANGKIPANSWLVFDVELVAVR